MSNCSLDNTLRFYWNVFFCLVIFEITPNYCEFCVLKFMHACLCVSLLLMSTLKWCCTLYLPLSCFPLLHFGSYSLFWTQKSLFPLPFFLPLSCSPIPFLLSSLPPTPNLFFFLSSTHLFSNYLLIVSHVFSSIVSRIVHKAERITFRLDSGEFAYE